MKLTTRLLTLGTLVLALAGCSGDLGKTDSGGVTLSLSDFNGLPFVISAGGEGNPQDGTPPYLTVIEELTITNVPVDPSGTTSDLMNVEFQGCEISYARSDRGTRLPPRFIEYGFGIIPVNGTMVRTNLAILKSEQFLVVPLSDLLDFGHDTETNSQVIGLNVTLRCFGRTLAGKSVQSTPSTFSLEVRP